MAGASRCRGGIAVHGPVLLAALARRFHTVTYASQAADGFRASGPARRGARLPRGTPGAPRSSGRKQFRSERARSSAWKSRACSRVAGTPWALEGRPRRIVLLGGDRGGRPTRSTGSSRSSSRAARSMAARLRAAGLFLGADAPTRAPTGPSPTSSPSARSASACRIVHGLPIRARAENHAVVLHRSATAHARRSRCGRRLIDRRRWGDARALRGRGAGRHAGADSVLHETVTGAAEVRPAPAARGSWTQAWDLASSQGAATRAARHAARRRFSISRSGGCSKTRRRGDVGDTAPAHERAARRGRRSTRSTRCGERRDARARARERRARFLRRHRPATRAVYSDLGFLLLTAALERLGGDGSIACSSGTSARSRAASICDGDGRTRRRPRTVRCVAASSSARCTISTRRLLGGIVRARGACFGSAREVAAAAAWQLRAFHGAARRGSERKRCGTYWTARVRVAPPRMGWGVAGRVEAGPRWPTDGSGTRASRAARSGWPPSGGSSSRSSTEPRASHRRGGKVPLGAGLRPLARRSRDLRPELHTRILAALGS
jgi:hypothetical protein